MPQKGSSYLYGLFRFLVLFLFIYSMFPWFTWNLDFRLVWAFVCLTFSWVYASHRHIFERANNNKLVLLCVGAMIMWIQKGTFMAMVFGFGICWCVYLFLLLKLEYKKDIINYITKWFSILLAVSLVAFFFSKIGFPLPHVSITFHESMSYSNFYNYYLFIQPESTSTGFRFCSIFLEPGHMVMGLAPLLFVNRYDVRNPYVLILFLALLSSFSLAGYIVTAVGVLWEVILRAKVKSIAFSVPVFLLFLAMIANFYASDLFDSLILQRLQLVDGQLAGNDRMNNYFAAAFEAFVKSPDFYFGKGSFDQEEFFQGHGNSGWQVFTYAYGLVGLLLCIIAYLSPALVSRKWSVLGMSVVLVLLLAGNGYPTWWCMLIHLTIGTYILIDTQAKRK